MKLISESIDELTFLTEENANGQKEYFIEGIVLQAEQPNKNGRKYPLELLQREVAKYNVVKIQDRRAYGELGHPDGPVINLDRVSHYFTELRQDGLNFWGKAKIMDTPYGKIVKNFIDEDRKLGISSRGLGSTVNKNGINIVQSDFTLLTAGDIVADPSAPNAFVQGIMEGVEYFFDEQKQSYIKKSIEQIIKETEFDRSAREEAFLANFNKFVTGIELK